MIGWWSKDLGRAQYEYWGNIEVMIDDSESRRMLVHFLDLGVLPTRPP